MAKTVMVYDFKEEIREVILARYGTFTKFCIEHADKGYCCAKLSNILNPLKSTQLSTIVALCQIIGYDIAVVRQKAA